MINNSKHLLEFDNFRIDLGKKVLWHNGTPVNLPVKAVEVLCALVGKRGEVVTKDEILDEVWPDAFVEESVISQNIHHLRKTFRDLHFAEDAIQTIPRRGYRFAGNIREPIGEVTIEHEIVERSVLAEISDDEIRELPFPEKAALTPGGGARITYKAFAVRTVLFFGALSIGLALWNYGPVAKRSGLDDASSVAILPLKSLTPDEGNDQLRVRITDALITRLGNLQHLAVRPTSSILQFSNGDPDPIEAGKTLQADTVIDGRVQVEGDRLRVTLQLLSVKDGAQLWSGQFDGKTNEILALQDLIAADLQRQFSLKDRRGPRTGPTVNAAAYEAYLKGRYLWNLRTPEAYWKALDFFQETVRLDPNFAPGYAGIADCYYLLNQRDVLSTDDAFPKAEMASRTALQIDPDLAEAHASLGSIVGVYHWRWPESEAHLKRAIELNPGYAEAYARYGMTLSVLGRSDEGLALLKDAQRLDPTSLNIGIYIGANYYFAGKFDEAITQFNRVLEFTPNTPTAHFYLSRIYEAAGRYDESIESNLREYAITKPEWVDPLRTAFKLGGSRGFWTKQIELMTSESIQNPNLDYHIASRYLLLDDPETSLRYLEKNRGTRGGMWHTLGADPAFARLRTDPRFASLLKLIS